MRIPLAGNTTDPDHLWVMSAETDDEPGIAAARTRQLPEPQCQRGFRVSQAEAIALARNWPPDELRLWMRSETVGVCEGGGYDSEFERYVDTGCGPDGDSVSHVDLSRFIARDPRIRVEISIVHRDHDEEIL